MGKRSLEGAGVLDYIRNRVPNVVDNRAESTRNRALRRDEVNERVFQDVIGKFGSLSKYDRSVIRSEIDAARRAVNDQRRVNRREAERERTPPGDREQIPVRLPSPISYEVDAIITWTTPDGTLGRARVAVTMIGDTSSAAILEHLRGAGVLDALSAQGMVSLKKKDAEAAEHLSSDSLFNVDVLSRRKL